MKDSLKYLLLTIFFLVTISIHSYSQNYTRAVGIRGGSRTEIHYRSYSRDDQSYDFLFDFHRNNMRFTALKLQFQPYQRLKTDNLWFGYGYGGHLGYTYSDEFKLLFNRYHFDDKTLAPVLGVDGYLTIEYRLPEIPLILGADYKPYFEFSTRQYFGLYLGEIGFTIKVQF